MFLSLYLFGKRSQAQLTVSFNLTLYIHIKARTIIFQFFEKFMFVKMNLENRDLQKINC